MRFISRLGLAAAAVNALAYATGPGSPRSSFQTATPVQTAWGGADALAAGVGGLVLWYLFRP